MNRTEADTPRVDAIAYRHDGEMLGANEANAQYNDLLNLARQLERALVQIEEILFDDLANRPSERARKAVMKLVAKALYVAAGASPA